MEAKVHERVEREGIVDYRIRPGSIQKRQVGGQPALSFIAEFTTQGEARVAFCRRLEPIVASLNIP